MKSDKTKTREVPRLYAHIVAMNDTNLKIARSKEKEIQREHEM